MSVIGVGVVGENTGGTDGAVDFVCSARVVYDDLTSLLIGPLTSVSNIFSGSGFIAGPAIRVPDTNDILVHINGRLLQIDTVATTYEWVTPPYGGGISVNYGSIGPVVTDTGRVFWMYYVEATSAARLMEITAGGLVDVCAVTGLGAPFFGTGVLTGDILEVNDGDFLYTLDTSTGAASAAALPEPDPEPIRAFVSKFVKTEPGTLIYPTPQQWNLVDDLSKFDTYDDAIADVGGTTFLLDSFGAPYTQGFFSPAWWQFSYEPPVLPAFWTGFHKTQEIRV